jgi:hypothetical protein
MSLTEVLAIVLLQGVQYRPGLRKLQLIVH